MSQGDNTGTTIQIDQTTSNATATANNVASSTTTSSTTNDDIPAKYKNADGTLNTSALLKAAKDQESYIGTLSSKVVNVDGAALAKEIADGTLSEQSIKELSKIVSEDTLKMIADAVLTSKQAKSNADAHSKSKQIVETFGGSDAVNSVIGWAKTNLTEQEIESFNLKLQNPDTTLETLNILKRMQQLQSGSLNNQLSNTYSVSGVSSTRDLTNIIEWHKVTNSKEYKTDPSYRKMMDSALLDQIKHKR